MNGLVSYWHFDETHYNTTTGEVKDAMSKHNGTAVGNANISQQGRYYRASTYDGAGDYINVPDHAELSF